MPIGITPDQFRQAYDTGATSTGKDTTIAVVSGGSDLVQVQKDLRSFEAKYNLPQVGVSVVNADGPGTDAAGDGEWDLDSQSSTGMAQNVKKLIFYNALSFGDINSLNQFAVDNKAQFGNMSYGGCEVLLSVIGEVKMDDQAFMQANAQGQTWFASSGDAGAACTVAVNIVTPDAGVPSSVEYPASSPYVIAVGGTTLVIDSAGNRINEIAWTAGGGGISVIEPSSDAQANANVVPTASSPIGFRAVPDIAMHAGSPSTGVPTQGAVFVEGANTFVDGSETQIIGTSLSSPLAMGAWARIQTAHCNTLPFLAPVIYGLDTTNGPTSSATGFNDVQVGSNGQWVATPGWDFTTGFGSMDVTAINAALGGSQTCTNVNTNTPPLAGLVATPSSGTAPLVTQFSINASDSDLGDSVTFDLDFGDGTSHVSSGTSTPHTYNGVGTFPATLTVTDSHGARSTATANVVVSPVGGGNSAACTVPGVAVQTDPSGDYLMGLDFFALFAQADITKLSIAEPFTTVADKSITFTLKVDNLLPPLNPNTEWKIFFDVKDTAGMSRTLFVEMDTNDPTSADPTNINVFVPKFGYGYLDSTGNIGQSGAGIVSGSFKDDGTIVIKLNTAAPLSFKALTGGAAVFTAKLGAGAELTNIGAETIVLLGAQPMGTGGGLERQVDTTAGDGKYTLSGNAACAPVPVAAMTASLSADHTTGTTPLSVVLTASATDSYAGHGPLTYTFYYGDNDGTGHISHSDAQSSPTAPTHTYTAAGTYQAYVIVGDGTHSVTSATVAITATTTVPVTGDTTARLSVSPNQSSYVAGTTVTFDGSQSTSSNGTFASYTFDFGDGATSPGTGAPTTATHAYTTAGTFAATLTVKDTANPQGSNTSSSVTITITANQVTTAQLIITPSNPRVGEDVTFDGSGSFPGTGATISTYTFDFGDQTQPVTGAASKVFHQYAAAGTYTPTLTVNDSQGNHPQAKSATVKVNPTSGSPAPQPAVAVAAAAAPVAQKGGALGLLTLLPLIGMAGIRRRKRTH